MLNLGHIFCVVLKNWTLRKVDQKYLESIEIWFRKRIAKINLDRSCEKWNDTKSQGEMNIIYIYSKEMEG